MWRSYHRLSLDSLLPTVESVGVVNSLVERARLRWLLRDEYESLALREWFARDFGVEIGLYSYGCFDRWRVPARTRIGRYCSVARTARILDANHPIDALTTHPFLYEKRFGVVTADRITSDWLVIEDDVWIAHNAIIAPTCKFIGRGAIVGAGAVVTHAVERYAIVAGMPAKLLRARFADDLIVAIEASRWWEMDKADLTRLASERPEVIFHPTVATLAKLRT